MNIEHVHPFFTYLQSQESTRLFLQKCYTQMDGIDARTKSYENASVFLAYVDHGLLFYKQGRDVDVLLKPLLYFYGMVHLLKACLLTVRPNYPEATAQLAHGVSARKRKKKDYAFLHDEVKVQHKGLLPYMSTHLFNLPTIPVNKVSMNTLFQVIPELLPFYEWQGKQPMVQVGERGNRLMTFPDTLLDGHHLTEQAFFQKIRHYLPAFATHKKEKGKYVAEMTVPVTIEPGPFFIHATEGGIFFPASRATALAVPEVIVHYLVLYNLGMLSRYEPGWWGDLLTAKPDMDYPLVKAFLDITVTKIPHLLGQYLHDLNERPL